MGVIFETQTVQRPNLHRYEPEFNADGSEKHIVQEGARFHVLSYGGPELVRCSCENCEINKRAESR